MVGRVGAGGLGVVYAALDNRDRRAAVECVHRVYASDEEFRARFAREVDLVRLVRATCTAAFLDADVKAGTPWLATEYVPGLTLRQYVKAHGPLTGGMLAAFAAV